MPKITKEQVEKINARMGNGWKLDLYYYLMRNEKAAELRIPTEDGYIRGQIYINKVWDWHPGAYNGIQIKLNVSRWYKDGDMFKSFGLGYWRDYNRPDLTRAMFSEVEKMTHEITAEEVLNIYKEHAAKIAEARVL